MDPKILFYPRRQQWSIGEDLFCTKGHDFRAQLVGKYEQFGCSRIRHFCYNQEKVLEINQR